MTIPTPEDSGRDNAFPDIVDDAADERGLLDDPQEPALPGDHYMGVLQVGTTVQEEIDGESLDRKVAREVPESYDDPAADEPRAVDLDSDTEPEERVGRLVDPDQGGAGDDEADLIGERYLSGEDDASPEEQAMHIVREP